MKMKTNKIITFVMTTLLGLVMMSSVFAFQELWSVSYVTTRSACRSMTFNPAAGHLIIGNTTDTTMLVYDTTGQYVKNMSMGTTVFTGAQMPYDVDATPDGAIWALHYPTGQIYRWDNENAEPTLACSVGTTNIRGFKALGSGANTLIYAVYAGNSTRSFIPVSASNYTTFQLFEQFGDSAAGNWSVLASGDTTNGVVYQVYPTGTQIQFARYVKTAGVWSRDSAFFPPFKKYAYKGEICPSNGDVYLMEYYMNAQGTYGGIQTRKDKIITRIDGVTGVQKEVYEIQTPTNAYVSNMSDIAFDTTNHILYWMHSLGVATTIASGNLQLGALRYTDIPSTPKVMEIPAITVDGNTTDWPSSVNSLSANWLTYPYTTTYSGAADYTGSFKVAWNHKQNRLYVLGEITDEATVSMDTWSNNWYAEDLVEMYFNPTNYYLASAQKISQIVVKLNGAQRAGGFGNFSTFQNYPYSGALVAINSTAVAGKLFYEVSVPLFDSYDTTGNGALHVLAPNEFIGFDADYVDQDGLPNSAADYSVQFTSPGTGKYSAPIRISSVWVKGIVLAPYDDFSLTVGLTQQFSQTGATGTVTWNSSNPTVGSITNAGLFSASTPGTTYITASDADGLVSLPIKVTVVSTSAPLASEMFE